MTNSGHHQTFSPLCIRIWWQYLLIWLHFPGTHNRFSFLPQSLIMGVTYCRWFLGTAKEMPPFASVLNNEGWIPSDAFQVPPNRFNFKHQSLMERGWLPWETFYVLPNRWLFLPQFLKMWSLSWWCFPCNTKQIFFSASHIDDRSFLPADVFWVLPKISHFLPQTLILKFAYLAMLPGIFQIDSSFCFSPW